MWRGLSSVTVIPAGIIIYLTEAAEMMSSYQVTLDQFEDTLSGETAVVEVPVERQTTPTLERPRDWYTTAGKRLFDYVGAALLLVLLAPVMLLAAAAVKVSSPGPAFFRQIRVGHNRREFRIWKIRTMVLDAEAHTGPVWSQAGDPRVTPLGRFLRASHIDEFPQLFNVLAGEMSLVGPRPERPEFVAQLEWRLSDYGGRLNVRPGITGLAQVLLPPDVDLTSVRRKLAHDLFYIRHLNAKLDGLILLYTVLQLLRAVAAVVVRPFRLPVVDEGGISAQERVGRH